MTSKIPTSALLGALLFSITPFSAPVWAQTPSAAIPLSAPNRILGSSGLRREAGNWLFNDSIFVSSGPNSASIATAPFLPNLRRDKKNKLPLWMPVATRESTSTNPSIVSANYLSTLGEFPRAYLQWSTLELPNLREMSRPGFDFAALQTQLATKVSEARARGQVFVGWSLPTGNQMMKIALQPVSNASAPPVIKRLRAVLDAIAPESALILDLSGNGDAATDISDLDAAAPLCDAVVLRFKPDNDLWTLKMARRVAEEQKEFDLPIFVAPQPRLNSALNAEISESRLAEFFMGGATGFIMPATQTPAWARAVSRNPGLFAGAVTLEDAAVLPSQNPQTLQIVANLRASGRVPLVGRLPSEKEEARGESLFAILDGATTLETLNGLDRAARAGSAIYLEGLPDLKNPSIAAKIAEMTGTNLEILPSPRSEALFLDDVWLFGDARGREIEVEQRVKWTIKTSLAGQTRIKKGEDTLAPYAAARLATDSNGLLMAPLGKGRLIWLAHAPTPKSNQAARRAFTAAIAGNLQGGLVNWKWNSVEEEIQNGGNLRVALRASKTGTPIIALWNDAPTEAKIKLEARGDLPIALDLMTEREIPAKVVGYGSNVDITVPAQGFIWLAFGKTRQALDKERLAPRPKARTK